MKVRVSKSAFNQHLFLQQYNCQQGLNSLAPEQNEDPVNLKSNLISHRKSLFFIFVSPSSLSLPNEGGFPPLRAALGLLQTGFSQPGGRGGGSEKGQDCLESSGCKSTGISGMGRDKKAQRGHTPNLGEFHSAGTSRPYKLFWDITACPRLGSWQGPGAQLLWLAPGVATRVCRSQLS